MKTEDYISEEYLIDMENVWKYIILKNGMHNMKNIELLKRQSIFGLGWNFDDYIHVHDYDLYKKYRNFILIKEKYKTSYYFMLFIDGEIYKITNEEDIEDILQIHFKNDIRKDKLNKLNYEK